MISDFIKNKHIVNRAGFGMGLSQISVCEKKTPAEIWRDYKKKKAFHPVSFNSPPLNFDYDADLDAEQKKQVQQRYREQNIEINLNFLTKMVNSEDQLREKMALFWHGHFASRSTNSDYTKHILNEIRKNSLGSFKDLLWAVSQAPAMLNFLNNQQNKKGRPNENFARELMELFTMGRGNYTEKDVREAARAFTGWSYDKEGKFIERADQHDTGLKTFLGKTGNFNGNDILNILLEQKSTAKFISTKIYRYLVNEKANEDHINELSGKFYESGYNIGKLLDDIFTSSWFFNPENIGNKIKSPIELMAGIMRILPMKTETPENLIIYQKLLGQSLLSPPSVAGWPSGRAWIDSSTLLLRMQIPQIWSGIRPLDLTPNSDDDLEMGIKRNVELLKRFKNPKISIEWSMVEKSFTGKNVPEILLQNGGSFNLKALKEFSDGSVRLNIINVMSSPEYQLC